MYIKAKKLLIKNYIEIHKIEYIKKTEYQKIIDILNNSAENPLKL